MVEVAGWGHDHSFGSRPRRYRQRRTSLALVDLRPQLLIVPAQEVLTSDGVPVKLSVVARWRITDPVRFVTEARATAEALYVAVQLALRAAVAVLDVEGLLADRASVDEALAGYCDDGCEPARLISIISLLGFQRPRSRCGPRASGGRWDVRHLLISR